MLDRHLPLVLVAMVAALACAEHRDREPEHQRTRDDSREEPRAKKKKLSRRGYEIEEAGGHQRFHDQLLSPIVVVNPEPDVPRPVPLALDVTATAIHVDDGERWISFPRHGRSEPVGQPTVQPSRGRLIAVPHDDSLMVWEHDGVTPGERRIVAAHPDDLDNAWTVLDYPTQQALARPLVVARRVAVVTADAILHAPLDPASESAGPGRLALEFSPKSPPRSDGHRLMWAAANGEQELVLAAAGRLGKVDTVWTQPIGKGEIIDAAPVGPTVVFIAVDRSDGVEKTPVLRVRKDGTIVEVLPGMLREPDEQLVPDGDRTWQFAKQDMFWWIGERAHAFSRVVEAEVIAVAADDGLLVWQQDDGLHVAGQQKIEFAEPFPAPEPLR